MKLPTRHESTLTPAGRVARLRFFRRLLRETDPRDERARDILYRCERRVQLAVEADIAAGLTPASALEEG